MPRLRATRADEIRTERRFKPGATVLPGLKLGVNEETLDRNKFAYRYANDTGNRVQELIDRDWDPVAEDGVKDDADGEGTVVTKIVGTADGKPQKAVLMRKRKDWHEADKKLAQKPLDEIDEAIRRGTNHQQAAPELRGEVAYTPGGSNTVTR